MTALAQAVKQAADAETAIRVAAERIGVAELVGPMPAQDVTTAGRAQRVYDAEHLAGYLEAVAAAQDALGV